MIGSRINELNIEWSINLYYEFEKMLWAQKLSSKMDKIVYECIPRIKKGTKRSKKQADVIV